MTNLEKKCLRVLYDKLLGFSAISVNLFNVETGSYLKVTDDVKERIEDQRTRAYEQAGNIRLLANDLKLILQDNGIEP